MCVSRGPVTIPRLGGLGVRWSEGPTRQRPRGNDPLLLPRQRTGLQSHRSVTRPRLVFVLDLGVSSSLNPFPTPLPDGSPVRWGGRTDHWCREGRSGGGCPVEEVVRPRRGRPVGERAVRAGDEGRFCHRKGTSGRFKVQRGEGEEWVARIVENVFLTEGPWGWG